MRENRPSGSEGGGTTRSPYPYWAAAEPHWFIDGRFYRQRQDTKMANRPGKVRFAAKVNYFLAVGGPGAQLQSVLFFLQELNRHYSILFEPAIKLAAIDSQRGGSLDLIAAKLLQHR